MIIKFDIVQGTTVRRASEWPEFRAYINGTSSSLAYGWQLIGNGEEFYEILTEPLLGFPLVHYLENTASADRTDWINNYRDVALREEGSNSKFGVSGSVVVSNNPIQSGSSGLSNGQTPVVVVGVPGANKARTIPEKGFSITNTDTGVVKFSTYISSSAAQNLVESVILQPNEKWVSSVEVSLGDSDKFFTLQLTSPITSSQPTWTVSFTEQNKEE